MIRIGEFSHDPHLAHIRWKVPLDRTRAKLARYHHRQRLAITPTQYPGPIFPLSPPSIVTNIQTFRTARFGTHNSGLTFAPLAATTLAGRPVQLDRGESASAN